MVAGSERMSSAIADWSAIAINVLDEIRYVFASPAGRSFVKLDAQRLKPVNLFRQLTAQLEGAPFQSKSKTEFLRSPLMSRRLFAAGICIAELYLHAHRIQIRRIARRKVMSRHLQLNIEIVYFDDPPGLDGNGRKLLRIQPPQVVLG